MHLFSIMQGAL